eukprot:PITA_08458
MEEKPSILFLQETRCTLNFLEKAVAKAWPGGQIIAVDAQGASGGLAILWDARKIQLDNIHANKNFIQAVFHLLGTNIYGHLTNVYFPQETQQKAAILKSLEQLNTDRMHPLWVTGGDFNMTATSEEKLGGRYRNNKDGTLLKDFIQNNWLIDLPTDNGLYTWTNKRVAPMQIASHLDRFLISDNAIHVGGEFKAHIIPFSGSDHWPIEMLWSRPGNNIKKPFRFEAFWLTHPEFKDFITTTWQNSNPTENSKMARFKKKLQLLKGEIKRWNKNTFGNIFREKDKILKDLKNIQQRLILEGRSEELAQKEQEMDAKLLERERQEELLWRQKSRIRWLKEGEKNTKFFHRTTVQRRMHNQISQITNAQGDKLETQEDIEKEFLQYFKAMSQEPAINRAEAIDDITRHIPRLITEEQNSLLLKPISLQEVEIAAKSLKIGKVPGPDGFSSNFFHHFWELIKWEVWQVVEESRSLRWMYPGLNATFIALIPKAEDSNSPEKFRPIALCNIIYKIVSKVVALRLKPLLPGIISPEQSGYVEGRQITDRIIISHEIIHSLKHSKKPGMLLKIHLSKAFDSISWDYIQKILSAFGFSNAWIRWIMSMISSSFFSILINGIPTSTFRSSRGLRQGDPLSPFLFIIMAEGLGRSLTSAIQTHELKGINLHNAPTVSHQQFVDDNMIFGYSSIQEARSLNSLLNNFSVASGACINRIKSQILFFNTHPSTQRAIARILGFSIASLPSKYLGAPLLDSAQKHSSWTSLLERLEARLSLWTHRSLNMASRLVLIKAVLQCLPLYLFSILAAPKWVLKAIKNLQRNFLWGSTGLNRKWALVKWEKACLPKKAGGIGLRDPEHSNRIMGAKIWWRWLSYPGTLWARFWTAKYANNLPLEECIRMTETNKGSTIWNSTILHRDLIQKHSFWEVKDGGTARFWTDSWQQLPSLAHTIQDIPEHNIHSQETVNQFWKDNPESDHRTWREAQEIIPNSPAAVQRSLANELQKRRILKENDQDKLRWGYEEKGTYTTKEAYLITLKDQLTKDKLWEKIWNPPIWPKISTFLWLLSHNRVLTWDNLRKRKFEGPSICLNCKQEEETAVHLMQLCPFSRKIWEKVTFRCQKEGRELGDVNNTLRKWPQQPYQSNILNTLWQILPGIEDFPSNDKEQTIWHNWQINLQSPNSPTSNSSRQQDTPSIWSPPPINTYMLNFDGASKGNPGLTGYGGAVRNHQGQVLKVFYGSIGWNTNNVAELEGLWRGLFMAQREGLLPLIVEGDSQLLINMAIKIQQGTEAQKVSRSWRMVSRLELLQSWLKDNKAITFNHIRREGNKLADFMANVGVDRGKDHFEGLPQGNISETEWSTYQEILKNDSKRRAQDHPDAGVNHAINV